MLPTSELPAAWRSASLTLRLAFHDAAVAARVFMATHLSLAARTFETPRTSVSVSAFALAVMRSALAIMRAFAISVRSAVFARVRIRTCARAAFRIPCVSF